MNKLYILLFIGSFASCSIVGYSAIFRKKDKRLLTVNPITQAKVAASLSLNKTEKIILIYALFIFTGCFASLLLSPAIETFMMQKL
jgi:hypothetical protein